MDISQLSYQINLAADEYLRMDLGMVTVSCPYWVNRLKNGKVSIRGQFNGKGSAGEIKRALSEALLSGKNSGNITSEDIQKIAKRNRIGIDCSGLVYRIMDSALRIVNDVKIPTLDEVFEKGIYKTNADTLTGDVYTFSIQSAGDSRPGDFIRLMGGKHIALVTAVTGSQIEYIHSAKTTKIPGVHKGKIRIVNRNSDLNENVWEEMAANGNNYGKSTCQPLQGDGIRRLRAFNE